MFSTPVPRTSFLDSRLRLRGRVNRLLERGMAVSDNQLAHVGRLTRPDAPLTSQPETRRDREA